MIPVNVSARCLLQIKLLHIGKDLLPTGQVLNQTVEGLEHTDRQETEDEPFLGFLLRT